MSLNLVADSGSDLLLDSKALKAIVAALRVRMTGWLATRQEDIGEDAFADLSNDIAYLEILLHRLEHTYTQRYGTVL